MLSLLYKDTNKLPIEQFIWVDTTQIPPEMTYQNRVTINGLRSVWVNGFLFHAKLWTKNRLLVTLLFALRAMFSFLSWNIFTWSLPTDV